MLFEEERGLLPTFFIFFGIDECQPLLGCAYGGIGLLICVCCACKDPNSASKKKGFDQ